MINYLRAYETPTLSFDAMLNPLTMRRFLRFEDANTMYFQLLSH